MANVFTTAIQGMQGAAERLEVVSRNVANISTPGYRREIALARPFAPMLEAAQADVGEAPASTQTARPGPPAALDLTAPAPQQTDRPLDLALAGEGFFEVAGPAGTGYTRAGNFRLDAAGRLVTAAGYPVQGLGGDIIANGSDLTIDRQGKVLQKDRVIGQLKIVRFTDAKALVRGDHGLLLADPKAEAGKTEGAAEVRVGYLEGSNVSSLREMTAMIEATRSFEALQKVFSGMDEALGTAIGQLGQMN